MATNPIPRGTCNFPVNLPLELRRDIGRLAFSDGKALGRWFREVAEAAVAEAYRTGRLIDRTAQRSLEIAGVFVVALGIGAVLGACVSGENDPRAFRRVSRRRRDEVCEVADVLA